PEFDHLALRVDLDEPWLVDVGFGDSFVDPLRLKVGIEQAQKNGSHRLVDENGLLWLERAESRGNWQRQYSFTLTPRELGDFADMCDYHQTSPESPFTRKSICSKATPAGRITLAGYKLIVTQDGKKEERVLASDKEWHAVLKERFGVVL